ncbi:hypothetical protein EVAR_83948_1 [Eumeta japonica]|uniref:Reverse transcriptase domain-containing protein n=1 Tax=Eumeta variegata TaxID=151549 RepID=A0A4C1VM90_EUMVA|nr:hypothetical protein EVAR_83948_1 [Eumeta japonica]
MPASEHMGATYWFDIRNGVKQGCVASTWLFNLFTDSYLYDSKEYEYRLKMRELYIKYLLYADDEVILAPSSCELPEMVTKINVSVKKRGINVSKTT